jgi:hypothetical protein
MSRKILVVCCLAAFCFATYCGCTPPPSKPVTPATTTKKAK